MSKKISAVEYVKKCLKYISNEYMAFWAIDAIAGLLIVYQFGEVISEEQWEKTQYPTMLDSLFDIFNNGTELMIIFCIYYLIKIAVCSGLILSTFSQWKKEHGYI